MFPDPLLSDLSFHHSFILPSGPGCPPHPLHCLALAGCFYCQYREQMVAHLYKFETGGAYNKHHNAMSGLKLGSGVERNQHLNEKGKLYAFHKNIIPTCVHVTFVYMHRYTCTLTYFLITVKRHIPCQISQEWSLAQLLILFCLKL